MLLDVKPSNILINKAGQTKLCDFGIAGQLVDSFCKTNIGCKPYLAVSNLSVRMLDNPLSSLPLPLPLPHPLSLKGLLPMHQANTMSVLIFGVWGLPW